MECNDKSPPSKAVPRHRTPKNGVFRGWCPPLNPQMIGETASAVYDRLAVT